VIVVCGPIASGKSSLAISIARALRREGRAAATIDLDLVYEMLSDPGSVKDDQKVWKQARTAAGALATALLQDGTCTVIAEGDFLDGAARREFLTMLPEGASVRFVTLDVPLSTALARVAEDPSRGISRDPAFLAAHYAALSKAMQERPDGDLCLDTSTLTLEDATQRVLDWARR
jgi:adenylylsulfate kinase-like enzyme